MSDDILLTNQAGRETECDGHLLDSNIFIGSNHFLGKTSSVWWVNVSMVSQAQVLDNHSQPAKD